MSSEATANAGGRVPRLLRVVTVPGLALALVGLFGAPLPAGADPLLVINEIMYHPLEPWPSSQPSRTTNRTEYVELFNPGTSSVALAGYRFDNGISYTFTNGSLVPGGYLVVCEDLATFRAAYPAVSNVVGDFGGSLNNGGERVTLSRLINGTWETEDTIAYLDDDSSDGTGFSLELVHPGFARLRNQYVGDWLASTTVSGTPGRVNSVYTNAPLPVAGDVLHVPPLPPTGSVVKITARITGRDGDAVTSVQLNYRKDALVQGAFNQTAMLDNGTAGDVQAGDGVYTAFLPPFGSSLVLASGDMLEYRIVVTDTTGARTFPALSRAEVAGTNLSYLIKFGEESHDGLAYPGEYRSFHLLLTQTNRWILETRSVCSEDSLDTTLVTSDGDVIYNCGLRLRGSSTRNPLWGNYRIALPRGVTIDGSGEVNLNYDNGLSQYFATRAHARSGAVASDVSLARVWMNESLKAPVQGGLYCKLEGIDDDYLQNHLPGQEDGNTYAGTGVDSCRPAYPGDLSYDASIAFYTSRYESKLNNPYTAWYDLQAMTYDLAQPASNYPTILTNRVNVPQWARSYAINICLNNQEAGYFAPPGVGDELRIYLNPVTGKGEFFPWDYSNVLSGNPANWWDFTHPVINKFLYNRPILPYYAGDLVDVITNSLSAANVQDLLDTMGSKGAVISSATTSFFNSRRTSILAAISADLTVNGVSTAAPFLMVPGTNAPGVATNINQNLPSAQWVPLGALALTAGDFLSIQLTRKTFLSSTRTLADAILLSNTVSGATIVLDDSDPYPAFSAAGSWITTNAGGYGGGGYSYSAAPSIGDTAVWLASVSNAGLYTVSAWLFATSPTNESAALYSVNPDHPSLALGLTGQAPQRYTDRVTVNGVPAEWNLIANLWTTTNSPVVLPGDVSEVAVRALHPDGHVLKTLTFTAIGQRTPVPVSGTLTNNVTWNRLAGIILLTNDLTIASGASLTVAPGTTLVFAPGRRLIVNGQLQLAGSPTRPVQVYPQGTAQEWTILTTGGTASVTVSNAVLAGGRLVAGGGATLKLYDSTLSGSTNALGIIDADNAAWVHIARCIVRNFDRTSFSASPTLFEESLLEGMRTTGIEFSGAASTNTVRRTTLRLPAGTDGITFASSTTGLVSGALIEDMSGAGVVAQAATVRIEHSVLAGCATGIAAGGGAAVTAVNNTIAGGGTGISGTAAATNLIVWQNGSGIAGGSATVAYSDVQVPGTNTYAGTGNMNRDPFFRAPAERDYQLGAFSPCLGAGAGGGNMGAPYPVGANPAAPTAPYLSVATNSLTLHWQDQSGDETGFEVYRAAGDGWVLAGTAPANAAAFTDSGLAQNASYTYRVRAVHARGASTYPDAVTATTGYQDATAQLVQYLRITEVMYNPPGTDTNEFIEFKNISSNVVLNLTGLRMDPEPASASRFRFPSGTTLGPQSFFVLVRNAAAFSATYPGVPIGGVYTNDVNLENNGEELWLKDANDADVLRFTYSDAWYPSTDNSGNSLVPVDPNPAMNDPNSPLTWRASSAAGGSPGTNDPPSPYQGVVISEILGHTDPPLVDSIEVHNLGTGTVNITGWYLSDNPGALKTYQIPATPALPPGGFKVFYATNSFNQTPGSSNCFAISEFGDEPVILSAATNGNLTGYRSTVTTVGAMANGVAYGRHTRSDGVIDFPALSARTLGGSNAYPLVGPVVISEIMYNPGPGGHEFVELFNRATNSVALFNTNQVAFPAGTTNAWSFNGAMEYRFPTSTVLAAGERILVTGIAPEDFRTAFSIPPSVRIFGPFDGDLANGGETIKLYSPDIPETNGFVPLIVVDRVQYDDSLPWATAADNDGASLERIDAAAYGNDPANWLAASVGGTPGVPNNTNGMPSVGFRDVATSRLEANETVWLEIILQPAVSATVTVQCAVSGGTAGSGTDYAFTNTALVFWPYETSKRVPLTILNDTTAWEHDETVLVALTNLSANAQPGGNRVYTHTIIDNDTNSTALAAPVIVPAGGASFTRSTTVSIVPTVTNSTIYYTLDGSAPTRGDLLYTAPFQLTNSARVTARTFLGSHHAGAWTSAVFLAQAFLGYTFPPPNITRVSIQAGSDDGREQTFQNVVNISESNLNFGASGQLAWAFRFNNVNIPRDVSVTNARVQFTSASSVTGACTLSIYAQAADNPPTFVAVNTNITSRPLTSNAVVWAPGTWQVEERGAAQQTANLAPLLNELLARPGWQPTNSVVIILKASAQPSTRRVYSYEGSQGKAAEFVAEWIIPQSTQTFYFAVLTNGYGTVTGGNLAVPAGSNATAYAFADPGSRFAGWSGHVGDADTNQTALTVYMDQDRTVTANFVLIPPPLAPFILSVQSAATNGFTLRWLTEAGKLYSVFRSTNLVTGWPGDAVATGLTADVSGTNSYNDSTVTNRAAFYTIGAENP